MSFQQEPVPEFSAARKRLPPAILAFFLQLLALLLVWGCWQLAWIWSEHSLPGWSLFLLQGIFAALLSALWGMARWWRVIHLVFPLAIFFMLHWQLPNWFYLLAFLFSVSLFWATYRTQVPFYPSLPATWRHVKSLIEIDRSVRVLDIGSGFGGLVLYLARERPLAICSGIELAPLPWLISALLALVKKSSAKFKYGNYQAVKLSEYDVVFAYLSPVVMPEVWHKARQEMRPGSLLISYEFEIPGVPPKLRIQDDPKGPGIFVWEM